MGYLLGRLNWDWKRAEKSVSAGAEALAACGAGDGCFCGACGVGGPAGGAAELADLSALVPEPVCVRALRRPTFLAYHSWSQRVDTFVPWRVSSSAIWRKE